MFVVVKLPKMGSPIFYFLSTQQVTQGTQKTVRPATMFHVFPRGMCHRKCHRQLFVEYLSSLSLPERPHVVRPFHAGHQTGSPFSDLGLVTSEPREEESSDFLGKRKLNLMAGERAPRSSHRDPHSLLTGKAGIRTQTCLTLAHFGQRPLSQKKGWPGSAAGPEGAWTRQCSVFSTWPCEHQRAGQAEKPGSWVQVQEMAKRM